MKRLLPTLVGLFALAAAVLASLVVLGRLFAREHEEALRALRDRQRAVEQYAAVELRRQLAERLAAAEPAMSAARRDPLADPGGLFWSVSGTQLVPPYAKEEDVPAQAERYFEMLRARFLSGAALDSPQHRRYELLMELDPALARDDPEAVTKLTRALLAERTREPLPLYEDGPVTLLLLEKLDSGRGIAPQLLRLVLRDGLATRDGTLEGLEPAIIRRRGKLAKEDFAWLCQQVVAVAQKHQVAAADFEARCRETPELVPPPPASDGRWLTPVGEALWYLEADGPEVRGVKVELAPLIAELKRAMGARALVAPEDALTVEGIPGAIRAEDLGLSWRSARLAQEEADATFRYRLKLLVLSGCMVLTLLLCALAVVAQRRKARFLELKSDFVSTVSHELKTPLASLRVMAETLERRLGGVAEAKDYPKRIVEQSDALAFLVENILSFNRLDKGRWIARKGPFALAQARAWLEDDAAHYREAKVEQRFEGFDAATLEADGELMRLLFLNLLRNACKYNHRDPVRLEWRASGDARGVTVTVTDNGVGLPREQWEAAFVEFLRLPGARGRGGGGAGLGLSLCRKIARMHRGELSVKASGPEGTTFELRLGR